MDDLVYRLNKRAEIRRQIPSRKSVQEGHPDRLSDLLEEAAAAIKSLSRDAELGRTAMRFVDRAGDVHPGIDDADTICADFHKAMSEVLEKYWNNHER